MKKLFILLPVIALLFVACDPEEKNLIVPVGIAASEESTEKDLDSQTIKGDESYENYDLQADHIEEKKSNKDFDPKTESYVAGFFVQTAKGFQLVKEIQIDDVDVYWQQDNSGRMGPYMEPITKDLQFEYLNRYQGEEVYASNIVIYPSNQKELDNASKQNPPSCGNQLNVASEYASFQCLAFLCSSKEHQIGDWTVLMSCSEFDYCYVWNERIGKYYWFACNPELY